MSQGATVRLLDGLSLLTRRHGVLRLVVLAAPVVAVVAENQAGATMQAWYLVAVGVLAAACAMLPDSQLGLLLVLVVGGHLLSSGDGSLDLWVLVMALALLVFHVATLLSTYGPPSMELEGALLLVWVRRAAVCAAVATLVWLAARIGSGLSLPSSALVFAAGLVLLAGWSLQLSRLVTVRRGEPR